jgi:mRNA turnover protein 4
MLIRPLHRWFENFHEADFARSGFIAPKTMELEEGPLPEFPHNMEPQLRQLGLPTSLKKGLS